MEKQLEKTGSLYGGILLVAGCCIGAGMLGLPVLSSMAGFYPSMLIFFICWAFMFATGLLLIEVNLWLGTEVSLVSLANHTLGSSGKFITWGVFAFLFYSLMVAYVAASGSMTSQLLSQLIGFHLEPAMGGLLFCLLFSFLLYKGTQAVDLFNRFLMGGLVALYLLLLAFGTPHVDIQLLQHHDWSYATMVIPAVIVSFGYHNLIPSLTTYYRGHVGQLVTAIGVGSAIPLVIYIAWEWLILGIVPLSGFQAALDHGEIATEALRQAIGYSWVVPIAQGFAFFAIITSFLSVALSFVDFLADGLRMAKDRTGKIILISLVLLPPWICALFYPDIFLVALNYAGGFGAVILFGILPAMMVWKGRYQLGKQTIELLPGGKASLLAVILFALGVMFLQII